ncbi:MAG: hypothetical protein AB8B78_01840 [Polaribacter sp.]
MKKIIIVSATLFLIALQSCSNKESGNTEETVTLTAKKVVIQYDNFKIATIKNNDSFIFDNHKMVHQDNFLQINTPFSLPSSNPILIQNDSKTLEEKINIISMAIIFSKKMGALNEYNFINLRQTNINGKLTIERKDGKDITIKKPKSYPLFIEEYTK